MKIKQFFIWGIPSFVLSFLLCSIWLDPTKHSYFKIEYWNALFRFGESLRISNALYVDKNKSEFSQLADRAIMGMASQLDRHSRFYNPTEYRAFKDDTHRRYVGIGVMIRKVEAGVLITRIFPNGPAEEAGLVVGEFILSVEGNSIADLDLGQVSSRIKGEEDTMVEILVSSHDHKERVIKVTRKKISVSSVEGIRVDENGTGYIRLVQFTSRSGEEFRDGMRDLLDQGAKRVILDLRDNAGGLLSAAIDVAECFLPRGQLIVSIRGRKKEEERSFKANPEDLFDTLPIVILMNGGSASASEIVGGALSVLGRAEIVGEQSFGKGSVQTIFPLSDNSGLRLTTAMYFLPDGSTIHEEGVEPKYLVECSEENETKLRIQKYSEGVMSKESFKEQFGFLPIVDEQLHKAEEVILNSDHEIKHNPR